MNNHRVGNRVRVIGCKGVNRFAPIGALGTVRKIGGLTDGE